MKSKNSFVDQEEPEFLKQIGPHRYFSGNWGKLTKKQPYISSTVVKILISQATTLSSLVAIGFVK